jgi:predicted DNA-binding protein YlxM (UPF0122 family)
MSNKHDNIKRCYEIFEAFKNNQHDLTITKFLKERLFDKMLAALGDSDVDLSEFPSCFKDAEKALNISQIKLNKDDK